MNICSDIICLIAQYLYFHDVIDFSYVNKFINESLGKNGKIKEKYEFYKKIIGNPIYFFYRYRLQFRYHRELFDNKSSQTVGFANHVFQDGLYKEIFESGHTEDMNIKIYFSYKALLNVNWQTQLNLSNVLKIKIYEERPYIRFDIYDLKDEVLIVLKSIDFKDYSFELKRCVYDYPKITKSSKLIFWDDDSFK